MNDRIAVRILDRLNRIMIELRVLLILHIALALGVATVLLLLVWR